MLSSRICYTQCFLGTSDMVLKNSAKYSMWSYAKYIPWAPKILQKQSFSWFLKLSPYKWEKK